MHSFTYVATVAAMAGFVLGVPGEDESAVLVKINPFISKSKKVIQFSGDRRYKRNGPEKSALYLEFPESFFEDPKLKRLYSSLIGGGSSGNPKKLKPDKTDIVFQIDPSAFGEESVPKKQEKRDVRGGNLAAFQLKIAPAASHLKQMGRGLQGFVPRHDTTKAWCMETTELSDWSPDPGTNKGVKEPIMESVTQTMCYPSKPSTLKMRICGGTTTEDLKSARPNDPCQCQSDAEAEQQRQVDTTPYDLYTQCKSQEPIVTHYVESLCFTTERCSPKTTFVPHAVDVFSTTYKSPTKQSCLPSTCSSTGPPFRKFWRRRRNKENTQLRNFFVLPNSPQSCPPFCPLKCTTSRAKCIEYSTVSPTTCKSTSARCPTTCSCPETTRTTCACPPSTCSTTCPTTSAKYCCPKVRRLDDPLRNVLRLFRRQNPRRSRRNVPQSRRKRRIWVYKPRHGLRKVNFQSKGYATGMK